MPTIDDLIAGDWAVESEHDALIIWHRLDGDRDHDEIIARPSPFGPPERRQRIADLIAATPRLYRALIAIRPFIQNARDNCYANICRPDGSVPDGDDQAELDAIDRELATIDAALTAARGEAP